MIPQLRLCTSNVSTKKTMNIEFYNDTFFSEKRQQMFTSNTDKPSTSIDEAAFKPRLPSPIPSTKELF